MAEVKPMPELAASVWENISAFLYPYEQSKILSLNKYINKLNEDGSIKIPQHNFQNDLNFWKEHFNPYQEFGFADINVKDKLTTLSLNNGVFDTITNEERLYLLYFLKYHTKIAPLYQPIVEERLDEDIEDYAGEFYKEIKFLFSLDLSDNENSNTMNYIIQYIKTINKAEDDVTNPKKSALLKEIYLNGNKLTDEHLLLFINTIKNNFKQWMNLRKLNLSDNIGITDKYIQLLFEKLMIERCDGLEYLGLESTSITDATIDFIYGICEKYPNKVWIKHLNIQFNNNITENGEDKITNDAFKEKFPNIAKGMKITI